MLHTSLSRKAFLMASILVLSACYISKQSGGGGDVSEDVSFESDVANILITQCGTSGCHAGASPAGGLNLNLEDSDAATLYTALTAQIDLDAPSESVLLAKATNATSHSGGEIFAVDSEDYQTILQWITDGAFNDNCDGVTHAFAVDVTPIFTQCTTSGCHQAGSTNMDLATAPFDAIIEAEAVNTDSPSASPLLRKPLNQDDDHDGGAVFDSRNEDYKTIFCWIKVDGAIEN